MNTDKQCIETLEIERLCDADFALASTYDVVEWKGRVKRDQRTKFFRYGGSDIYKRLLVMLLNAGIYEGVEVVDTNDDTVVYTFGGKLDYPTMKKSYCDSPVYQLRFPDGAEGINFNQVMSISGGEHLNETDFMVAVYHLFGAAIALSGKFTPNNF